MLFRAFRYRAGMSKFTLGDAEIHYDLTGDPSPQTLALIPAWAWIPRLWAVCRRRWPWSARCSRMTCAASAAAAGGGAAITVPSLADDVAAMLDHLRIRRAHICGVSFGGKVALDFARRYPDRTLKLILAATHGPAMLYNRLVLQSFEILLHRLPGGVRRGAAAHAYSPAWMRDNPAAMEKMEALRIPSLELMAVMRGAGAAAQAWLPDLPPDFAAPPTLILCGARGCDQPAGGFAGAACRDPRFAAGFAAGRGHSLFAEAPRECRRAILEFPIQPRMNTDKHG